MYDESTWFVGHFRTHAKTKSLPHLKMVRTVHRMQLNLTPLQKFM